MGLTGQNLLFDPTIEGTLQTVSTNFAVHSDPRSSIVASIIGNVSVSNAILLGTSSIVVNNDSININSETVDIQNRISIGNNVIDQNGINTNSICLGNFDNCWRITTNAEGHLVTYKKEQGVWKVKQVLK